MNTLVTGGAGFVGTNLIKRLLKEGHKVTCLDNYSSGLRTNEQEGCTYHDIDLCDVTDYSDYILDCDVIFHVAALARIQTSLKEPRHHIINNFESTLNILDWSREKGGIPIVYAGSSSKHHGVTGSPYAWVKWSGEELCKLYSDVYNVPTSICRFYNVYGKHQLEDGAYATVVGIFEKQYRENKPLTVTGDGEQRRDFTHIDDIVDGIVRCGFNLLGDNPIASGQAYELGRGKNYSINELSEMFGQTEVEYIPARKGEYQFTLADYTKANQELDWTPTLDIKDYISEVIK